MVFKLGKQNQQLLTLGLAVKALCDTVDQEEEASVVDLYDLIENGDLSNGQVCDADNPEEDTIPQIVPQ